MTLKKWRNKYNYTQPALMNTLIKMTGHKLVVRTIAYWETGTMPRKHWLNAIAKLTGNKVTAVDFLNG